MVEESVTNSSKIAIVFKVLYWFLVNKKFGKIAQFTKFAKV